MSDYRPIRRYLLALADVCVETANEPRLLPDLLRLLQLVPQTIFTLLRQQRARRIAA